MTVIKSIPLVFSLPESEHGFRKSFNIEHVIVNLRLWVILGFCAVLQTNKRPAAQSNGSTNQMVTSQIWLNVLYV